MTASIESIIAKVQRLRALSASDNLNEANSACAAADRLIEEYRLSEAQLSVANGMDEAVEEDSGFIYESGKITPWKSSLACSLAKHYGCVVLNDIKYNNGRQVSRYKLIGRKSDIGLVNYMFSWLCAEICRLSINAGRGMGRVFINSYCLGAVNGIRAQLETNKVQQKDASNSAALMKLDQRVAEADAFLRSHRNISQYKPFNSSSRLNMQAYASGQSSGKNIHLGKAIGISKNKQLGN